MNLSPRYQTLAIGAAIACVATVGVALSLSLPLLAFTMQERGASGAFIGLNTAMAGLATIITAPLAPYAAARLGVSKLLVWSLAIGSLSFLGFWAAKPLWIWFPLRFLLGAALAVLFTLSEFWINAAAPPRLRGLIMGIYATALSAGFALGPLLLGQVERTSFYPYLLGIALFGVAALPILMAGRWTPSIQPGHSNSPLSFIWAVPAATLAACVFGAIEVGGMNFFPLYGTALGYGETMATLIITSMAVGTMLLQIPIGILSDRMDRRRLLMILSVSSAAGAALIPLFSFYAWMLLTFMALWGGVVASLYTVGLAHLGERYDGADLASANAAFVMLYSVGMLVGPPLLGLGFDLWHPYGLTTVIWILLSGYSITLVYR